MENVKVGIPHSLFYYLFSPLWETFFQQLGMDVVASSPTTKRMLNAGIKETVTDACIPVKIFHGHVTSLKNKVDVLFIPRLVRWDDTDTFCPKFLGLPDMITHGMKGLPPIIAPRVDARYLWSSWSVCKRVAQQFRIAPLKAYKAYRLGLGKLRQYRRLLLEGWTPEEANRIMAGETVKAPGGDTNIALLGYPYNLYDSYTSSDVVHKLRRFGVRVLTADMVSRKQLNRQNYDRKQAFWHFSDSVLRAGMFFLNSSFTHGIIHLTAFGCGPDFLVNKILEIESEARNMPFITLSIDEQSGDAGVQTRIEAFLDMLQFRKGRVTNDAR